MPTVIKLPQFGETMEEGTIVACRVKLGDHVKSGDVLFDIETDKATLEIESPADGYVKQIMAKLGQSLQVGTPLLILGKKDEQISDEFIRLLKVSVTPATKSRPEITAEHADITEEKNIITSANPPLGEVSPSANSAVSAVKLGQTIPVNRLQRITAQKMLRSKQEIPSFYLTVRADVTELVAYRSRFNQTSEIEVAYNDFVIKAVAMGLQQFPIMTGQLDGDNIKLAGSIGIGLAIAVPQGLVAPIVKWPDKKTVIEIARYTQQLADRAENNQLTLEDLEGGCITVSNLGMFGIDSFIPIVVPGQCSILGIGQIKDACIPSIAVIGGVPDDGNVNVRKVMNMTLSVDHRVANGAYAAKFLDFVKKVLEDTANFR
jgi:pyruvate dehydrogenase E2 component (dihydrolipoamide acetyltransferase)